MSPIYIRNGKILIRDGKLATDSNCCCNTCTNYADGCYEFTCEWSIDFTYLREDPCCASGYGGTNCNGVPWTTYDYLGLCPQQCMEQISSDTQSFSANGEFSGMFEVSGNQTSVGWSIDNIDGVTIDPPSSYFWNPNGLYTEFGYIQAGTSGVCVGDIDCATTFGSMGDCMRMCIEFVGSLCVTCSGPLMDYSVPTDCGFCTDINLGTHSETLAGSGDSSYANEWQYYVDCDPNFDYDACIAAILTEEQFNADEALFASWGGVYGNYVDSETFNCQTNEGLACDCENRLACLLSFSEEATIDFTTTFTATPIECPPPP